ncbi:MAG: hypothetical protein AAFV53_42685, partial [Myxococcota bacterium]
MKVFAEGDGGDRIQVLPIHQDVLYDTGRQGHPLRTLDTKEKVELFMSQNLYQRNNPVLVCDGTPRALDIELQCNTPALGGCDRSGEDNSFLYIADVEMMLSGLECIENYVPHESAAWASNFGPIVGWVHDPGAASAPYTLPRADFVFAQRDPLSDDIELKVQPYLTYEISPGYTEAEIVSMTVDYGDAVSGLNVPPVVSVTYVDSTAASLTPNLRSVTSMAAFPDSVVTESGISRARFKTASGLTVDYTDVEIRDAFETSLGELELAGQVTPQPEPPCYPVSGYFADQVVGELVAIELDLDTATGYDSSPTDSEFVSESNRDYRYLDRPVTEPGVLDSAIVRYTFPNFKSVPPGLSSTYNVWRTFMTDRTLERQIAAMGEAIQFSTRSSTFDSYNLAYLETTSWVAEYRDASVRQVLNHAQALSDGLMAGLFSLSWYNQIEDVTSARGEFTERTQLNTTYDLNDVLP